MPGLLGVLILLASPLPASTASDPPPILREVELRGVTFFEREAVLKALRLRLNRPFRREVSEVAASLYAHYDGQCFTSVVVEGAFDPATGKLTLTVDEGRLASVEFEGLEGDSEARARELLGLEPGRPLREKDLRAAIERLERGSRGAFRTTGERYALDRTPEGVRLRLLLSRSRTALSVRPKGPDLSPLYNRVEGSAPGISAELTVFDRTSFNHTGLYGRASYGFAAKEPRYAVGIRRAFGPGGRLALGYEFHDMTDSDDVFRRFLVEEPLRGRSVPFSILEDYHRRHGHEAYAFLRPTPRLHLGLNWRSDRHESLPVEADDHILVFARRPRPNPPAWEGLMRSILVTARWSRRDALYRNETAERESFLVRNPYGGSFERTQGLRADATWEEAFDGDFSFRRVIGQVRGSRHLTARQGLSARVLAGFTGGDPPLQRRFALGGAGTLRGYGLKAFAGDRMALASLEWTYQPVSRFPSVVAFYDGGVAWSRGRAGEGWKDDLGIGLEWPEGGRGYLRADLAFPLRPLPGQDRARLHALLRIPF